MKARSLKVETTAHYYAIGELNANTKDIWIVCHGYGQLASFFLRKFQALDAPNRYIVAPEGFNKFYLKGFSGRVGASWMTKEKREDEIEDHCAFLEQLLDDIVKNSHSNYSIKILGFSQGTATVSRWLLRTKHNIDALILWGGKIANDFDFQRYNQMHSKTKNYVVFGDQDEFYTTDSVEVYKEELIDFNAQWINYKGGHNIDSVTLDLIEKQLI